MPDAQLGYDADRLRGDHPLERIARTLHVLHADERPDLVAMQLWGPLEPAAGVWSAGGTSLFDGNAAVVVPLPNGDQVRVELPARA